MDRMMGLTKYQICRMKDMSEKFYLLEEDPQCVNVCFWYLPKRFRGTPMTAEKKVELGKVSIFRQYLLKEKKNTVLGSLQNTILKICIYSHIGTDNPPIHIFM